MTNTTSRNVVPSEVGWQFVPQYYTFVNKQPDRLHCFYTKKSTFIHGTEGEDGKPCHGQQEIHAKITSLGFQDCKVFIHSVDAQASAEGGIIIQVIGEMSNQGQDWKKFVQTFFLAEQPNGYFVLNDIFRFLKEETVDSDELEADAEPTAAAQPPVVEPPKVPEPPAAPVPAAVAPEPSPSPAPPAALAPVPEPVPIEEPTTVAELTEPDPYTASPPEQPPASESQQQPTSRPNGITHDAPVAAEKSVPTPAAPAPAVTPVERSRSAAPTPPPTTVTPTPPVSAAPAPRPPSTPKTWANLAAANSKKWGSAVAQESRGTTEVVPVTPGQNNAPASPSTAQGQGQGQAGGAGRSQHPLLVQAQSIPTPHCFIKGVTEQISQQLLTSTLTTRFGPLKELEIIRSKACAFGEFTTLEAARKAIIASLGVAQGGEGGIFVELPEGGQARIFVDPKKDRNDRPAPNTRPRGGGADNNPSRGGGGGGGSQGQGGGNTFRGRGRGRGGPPGGK